MDEPEADKSPTDELDELSLEIPVGGTAVNFSTTNLDNLNKH
jgi:hypothetical protein